MDSLTAALNSGTHDVTPVWFMRQAGRYLPGYTALRKKHSIKEICSSKDLTVKVTDEPIGLLGVDAAIIFSDITIPLEAMGFKVDFKEGIGPIISRPFQENRKLEGVHGFERSAYSYATFDAISMFKEKFPAMPLIGFSGGPLTVASYVAGGKADRDLSLTRSLIYRDDRDFQALMKMILEMVILNCREQVRHGADAIQIFDSWAGFLPSEEFKKYASAYLQEIVSELSGITKVIYFSTQTTGMLGELDGIGFDFLSLDWRTDLASASRLLKPETGLQGNLDPLMVAQSPKKAISEAQKIAASMKGKDNYIFNLGHGVLPSTDPGTLGEIVRTVHKLGEEK